MKVREYALMLLLALNVALLLISEPSMLNTLILVGSSFLFVLCQPMLLVPLIYISSFSTSFVALPVIAGYFYYVYLFIFACFLKYPSFGMQTRPPKILLWMVVYAIWIYITALDSVSHDLQPALKMIAGMVPLLFVHMFRYDIQLLYKYMFVAAISASVYLLLKLTLAPEWYVAHVDNISLLNLMNAQLTISEEINPNTVAQCALMNLLIMFSYAMDNRKWRWVIPAILSIAVMIMVGSRTSFIALLIIPVTSFVLWAKTSRKIKVLAIAAVIAVAPLLLQQVYQANERLDIDTIVDDDGSGRFNTWESLWESVIPANPISGVGFGRINLTRLGYAVDADNLYIDSLAQMGIVGLALLMIILVGLLIVLWRHSWQIGHMAVIFMMFIFTVGFGETVYDMFLFVFVLMFSLMSCYSYNSNFTKLGEKR